MIENPHKTFEIFGEHGSFSVDTDTGFVLEPRSVPPAYSTFTQVDIEEYRQFCLANNLEFPSGASIVHVRLFCAATGKWLEGDGRDELVACLQIKQAA